MHPNFLDEMSWEMAEVYGAIEDQILINLARHFPFYVAGETVPRSAFVYQAQMLAQMGQVNKETIQIIRNGLADADPALQNVLEQSVIDAVWAAQPELVNAAKWNLLHPMTEIIVSPNQSRAFQLYYQQASDKLNLVNTVMLESTQSAYKQAVSDVVAGIDLADRMNRTQIALDTAAGETITGVSSWNQALRHATDKMANGGIVGFVDHAGRQWTAESYVAMDMRTTTFNTARAAVWETNQGFGNDLYLVSWHNGARTLCFPWQNKVISADNRSGVTYDLDGNEVPIIPQSETSYGEPAGLFGINCRHYPTPWIPGVSIADGTPQDKEDNDKVYAESQEQRRLERKLREEKRDLMMAKAQGRPQEELDRLRDKCRETSGDIDEFCKSTGRARHRDREGVYTKREFPDKEKYNVADFERKQKELIDNYYRNRGAQQGYSFGEMTPKEPIERVAPPSATGTANPAVSNYGKAFDGGNTAKQKQMFADAKEALKNSPENTRKVWDKVSNEMNTPIMKGKTAYYPSGYKRGNGTVHFRSYAEGFQESCYQRKNYVFFHEYGHNIDELLGGGLGKQTEYFSVTYKGGIFGKTIERECQSAVAQFYAQSGMTVPITDRTVGKAFADWVKNTYTIYERGDISDMFERYMIDNYGIQFPFGVGHGSKYHRVKARTAIEAFAEMYGSTVTGCDSLDVIKKFFPDSYKIFEEMIASVV